MVAETALERVNRILELIPYLQGRAERLSDLAKEFEVPVEILMRDLEIAFMSGMPGYTPDLLIEVTIDSEMASVQEAQSLDLPPAMDESQTVKLLLGLKLLLGIVDLPEATTKTALHLLSRVEQLLGDEETNKVSIEDSENGRIILKAIHNHDAIAFQYLPVTGSQVSTRKIEPFEIYWRSGHGLVRAFDTEANGMRNFFLTRMEGIEVRGKGKIAGRSVEIENPFQVEIVLADEALWWTKRYGAFITDSRFDLLNKSVTVTLEFWDEDWLVRILASVNDLILSVKGLSGCAEKIQKYLEFAV